MAQNLTMKNLGDDGDKNDKKSSNKFDKDWSQKIDAKITKLTSTVKALTNKLSDLEVDIANNTVNLPALPNMQ